MVRGHAKEQAQAMLLAAEGVVVIAIVREPPKDDQENVQPGEARLRV